MACVLASLLARSGLEAVYVQVCFIYSSRFTDSPGFSIMSEEREPAVNVCDVQNPPLSRDEASKGYNIIQQWLRSSYGALGFILLGVTMGPIPAFGLPPLFFFLGWLGVHWLSRRVFDWCTANWICIMCVSQHMIWCTVSVSVFSYFCATRVRSLYYLCFISVMSHASFTLIRVNYSRSRAWKLLLQTP